MIDDWRGAARTSTNHVDGALNKANLDGLQAEKGGRLKNEGSSQD
jgi:hypothetical protein